MSTTAAPPATQSPRGILKRLLVGRRLSSSRLEHTLLPKVLALPVFASDALSSVAYATEEILTVLLAASIASQHFVMPIAIAIALLLAIVVTSYRQTVRAYPGGGGAYIVVKENIGKIPSLVAAAALLTDYVLTVAVSAVAGVFAIVSAVPSLNAHKVLLSLGFVALITLANLRGVKESGILFATPTYAFILSILTMVGIGLARCAISGCPATPPVEAAAEVVGTVGSVSLLIILHAFSSGATALTGVEAVADGVPAFRRPQAKNAARTLAIMGAISITMFLGISYLASHIEGVTVSHERSVVAQIAFAVFGGGPGFYIVQVVTAAILILAANTSFQDFPRLSSILAGDRFLPRQFMNRGDRLVFSNGVLMLAGTAGVLIYVFDASLTRLIQLYVVGVFTSFTLSQTGMVRRWLKERRKGPEGDPAWKRSIVPNAIGAVSTFVVLIVVTSTKFVHGAWIVIVAIPFIVLMFESIHRHYLAVAAQLRKGVATITKAIPRNHVVLLVTGMNAATAEALGYVRSFRPADFHAIFPAADGVPPGLKADWAEFARGGPELEIVPARRGQLLEAIHEYLLSIPRGEEDFATVVVPELTGSSLSLYLLGKSEMVRLKAGLLREPNVVVTDVPVVVSGERVVGVDGKPLIPTRTEALVFISAVHDPAIRAVNYARTLQAAETRAIHFALDPARTGTIVEEWARLGVPIPLEVVEAPFRDLSGPMLREVRRVTARPDTVAAVVVPEFVVPKWRHLLLHNQNALFVKRLLLFEPRVILSAVPFILGGKP